jgi:hypothetical protein
MLCPQRWATSTSIGRCRCGESDEEDSDEEDSVEREDFTVTVRRLTGACIVSLVALVGASCSSGGSDASNQQSTTTAPAPTTTAAGSPTTTAQNAVSTGTHQTTSSPSGEKLSVVAGTPEHVGASVGGPPGSWEMGFVVENTGTNAYPLAPRAQVTMVASSGTSYPPALDQVNTAGTGAPTTVAAGQQARVLLVFALPSGTTPTSVVFVPFGTSVAPLRWTVKTVSTPPTT